MKQFNVPPSLPLARARPNPIISRRSSRTTNFQYSSINGTRQASNDGKDTWKISRRPVFTKPIQVRQSSDIYKRYKYIDKKVINYINIIRNYLKPRL